MMPRIFHNPVAVYRGEDGVQVLARLLRGRSYVLVTSRGWHQRGVTRRIADACGDAAAVIDSIRENPTIEELLNIESALARIRGSHVTVVALGGGSVIDAAKAILVGLAPEADMTVVSQSVHTGEPLPDALSLPQLLCIPTTAGTGSEVTCTATIWDGTSRVKYSLADARLFPTAAILDATLTATAPWELTLSTGLGALSHAMESIWNIHHTEVSDAFAAGAIARLKRSLPRALAGADLAVRTELQYAAMLAGFAISSTRTALAHSISYPLTARFGLRHGLACSFTLPEVAMYNLTTHPERIQLIADAFGVTTAGELPGALRKWLESLGVYDIVRQFVEPRSVSALGISVITHGRADNNIRPATAADAHAILYSALDEKTWSHPEPRVTTGCVVWITGLSGAGKTTLARAVVAAMCASGRKAVLLDSHDLRAVISGHVGHSLAERRQLAERYSALCRFLAFQGVDVVCATMSLFRDIQRWNRANIPGYVEVYLKADFNVLISRDRNGLYRQGPSGTPPTDVVGRDLPFDEPSTPNLVIDNSVERSDIAPLVAQVLALLPPR